MTRTLLVAMLLGGAAALADVPDRPVPPECQTDADCVITTFPGCCGTCCPMSPYASSAKRLAAFPDTPTMAEAGYPQLTSGSWQGIFVPTGTPKEAVDRLYGVTLETMKDPQVRERLANGGVEVVTSAPGEFAQFVAKETERWGQAVREAGATAE